jgi:pimeloyl-ACP methyl ester carboxylesterase
VKTETVAFHQDDGLRLEGELVLPEGVPRGAVAIIPGFRATRRAASAPLLAERLAAELGWAALLFDFTGYGDSAGPRGRFDPETQVADIRSAVSFLRGRLSGLPVSLYGNSFGAAMATVAAARDGSVAALFALCPFSSGARLMADQRQHWQVVEFQEALARDRLERVTEGRTRPVEPDWIMVRDPEAAAYVAGLGGAADRSPMDVAAAERLAAFEPIAEACRLRGRPALFAHCERDHFIPAWHSHALAEAAGGRALILPGYGHYAIYEGAPREVLWRHAVDFYRVAVPT